MQKHYSVVPYTVTSEHNCGILPVSEAVYAVNVFISNVDTSAEGYLAVNNKYLAVIPVVLDSREEGSERIEYPTLNSLFRELFLVPERQRELRAHSVIQKPYLDPL